MNKTLVNKIKPLLTYAALPILLAALFLLLADTTSAPYREVHGENGVWDLREFDFENYNALLVGDVAFIPYALLAPDEFAARSSDVRVGNTANITFLTSRVVILVSDDEWYTFARDSILHSHRQYANGEWLSFAARGRPGYNRESEIAGEGKIVFTVRPQNGVIELVQQSSSFVHARNDHHMGWRVGVGVEILYESRAADFLRGIEIGIFFLLFLLFLLMFFTLQRNHKVTLYFSLFCLMWVMRMGVTGVWPFTVLMPWMDWVLKFRIQYIALPVAAIFTFAIINTLFPKILQKIPLRMLYISSAALIVLYLFADTVFMSHVLLVSYGIFGLGILYILFCFVLKVRNVNIEQGIFIGGMVLFMFAAVSDFFYFSFDFIVVPFEMTGVGMLVFALCAAASVFIVTMKEVENAKKAEQLAVAESAALDSLNRMKTIYLTDLTHEIKTPLTIVSVHVQKALHRYAKNGGADEQIADSLKRAQEVIMRMSRMVENALKMSSLQETDGYAKILDVAEIIGISAEANRSFIERRGNTFIVSIEKNLPSIMGKADEIVQVVLNILTNANNHTQNGEISLHARSLEAGVMVSIADNGTGIPAELLPRIFERGVSGGGGTGFGLAICKSIIEAHGGTIDIKSEEGKGTTVIFSLPTHKEGAANV